MANDDDETTATGGSDLALLKQQRSTMKRNTTNIQKKNEKDGDKVDATILQFRMQILEAYFKEI